MTVYSVVAYWWDTYEFLGVFRNREAADDAGKEYCFGEWTYEIYETELVE